MGMVWRCAQPSSTRSSLLIASTTTPPTDRAPETDEVLNIVLGTSDLSRLCSDYRNRGVKFRQTPKLLPRGGEAIIEDLYGNSIVLVGPIAKTEPESVITKER